MIESVKPIKVRVNRGFGHPFEATTDHSVFKDVQDPNTGEMKRGEYLGTGVLVTKQGTISDNSQSFVLYAQLEQMEMVEA